MSLVIGVTLTFDGTPQIIVQRCLIAALRWPNDISSAADNAIFKNIKCSFGCVTHRAILLKPNVANILLFNFCEQKFIQHGPITIAIDCKGLLKPNLTNILLFNFYEQKFVQHNPITITIDCNSVSFEFSKKNGPIMALDQSPHQIVTRFGCVGFTMYACGFSVPQCCSFTYPPRSK